MRSIIIKIAAIIFVLSVDLDTATSHELIIGSPNSTVSKSIQENHQLYHRIRGGTKTVGIEILHNSNAAYEYLYDEKNDLLYTCIAVADKPIADTSLCENTDKSSKRSKWSTYETQTGSKFAAKPKGRHYLGSSYLIFVPEPQMQTNSIIYFHGNQKVIRCQTTVIYFDFDYEKDGQTFYFPSEKEEIVKRRCKIVS